MPPANGDPNEHTRLLDPTAPFKTRVGQLQHDEASSIVDSHVSKEEQELASSSVGERLPYNDYTTIDWLHDLVKDSYRYRMIHGAKGLRNEIYAAFDSSSGWIAVALSGILTACVAFCVDVAEATVSDWKYGYCKRNPFMNAEACCEHKTPLATTKDAGIGSDCDRFHHWSSDWWKSFGIYLGFALAFGIIAGGVTMLTRRSLPSAGPGHGDQPMQSESEIADEPPAGKSMYMAAGSGIPEIKTHLSGFVIPHFLDLKVLIVKAVGATFAVATGMCLGKEGPFVHISGCVGYLVASCFERYRENSRKMRELLSAAVAAGLSVAFGAPIGGVLFAYEEISTYFPRRVLWRSFLCSASAAIILKMLNPTGTGKLILFETHYGTKYSALHYFIFVVLGIAGGIWGGLFCKLNFKWSKWFRGYRIIKDHPVLEVFLVVFATVLLQYPNPLTRLSGDVIIKNLLVDCREESSIDNWICQNEAKTDGKGKYIGWLVYGCSVKLILTIITFGAKVPSGIIIPAMDGGSLFGRLIGQWVGTISPGVFAMVGAGAFLAGVSRMTVSLVVIMLELTGELEYILPHMIAILVAKWVADSLSAEGVYDLAQTVLGHPFLDLEHAMLLVQKQTPPPLAWKLIPPPQTMDEITIHVHRDSKVPRSELERKLNRLHERGLMDAGLVLVQDGILQGYLAEGELEFGLNEIGKVYPKDARVRLLGERNEIYGQDDHHDEEDQDGAYKPTAAQADELDLTSFVDRTPLTVFDAAPMEYVIECFGKLGLRHMMVTEEGTGKLVGVIIKKRLLAYLESLH